MVNLEAAQPRVRLAEVIACLALATDLANGQPLEHGLRRTLLAVWLGEDLGLDEEQLSSAYYVALLGTVGCTLDGAAFSGYVKDEIAVREKMVTLDPSRTLQMAAFFIGRAGEGDPPLTRLKKFVALSSQSQAICRDVALQVGGLLDLGPAIREALGQCDEHWNGKGPVLGLKGEEISLAARLFIVAHDVEVFNRLGGLDAALAVVRERSGRIYDPQIASCFLKVGPQLLTRLQSESAWDGVLAAEPAPWQMLTTEGLDDIARKVANFVDMRSTYTVGHSPRVASLAAATARGLGLSKQEITVVRQAGLLHDLGRAGVPVATWDKAGALASEDWQRMQRHPSLTELVLARSSALGHLGTTAGLHHERLDGSGYRGVSASSLPLSARLLAAADAFQTKLEPRPHRAAMSPSAAAEEVKHQVKQGKLDSDVVAAMLAATGQRPPAPQKRDWPAGLSEREVEVLRLAIQGLSNRQMAESLVVSPKTVGHHIERIYDKIGCSTRVGATLFALQHGLIPDAS